MKKINFLQKALQWIAVFFTAIFGKFSWKPPTWLNQINNLRKKKSVRFSSFITLIILFLAVTFYFSQCASAHPL